MIKPLCALSLAALCALPLLSAATPCSAAPGGTPNLTQRELLVVWDWTGTSPIGPTELSLEVYSDGGVKISGITNGVGKVRVVDIGPVAARELARELYQAGAWELADERGTWFPPLVRTLTVLRGSRELTGHTFNYGYGQQYQAIDNILLIFIVQTFPGF